MSNHAQEIIQRCSWAVKTTLEQQYHDTEWGVPIHDETRLFEFLILEGAQAGLSWITVLKKRDHYRKAFDHFQAEKIADYSEQDIDRLMANPGIVRNRLKIQSAILNAKAYLRVQESFGSFDSYLWSLVGGETQHNAWPSLAEVPAHTSTSDAMSKDLKKRGFKFVGSTICYAFMQAVGMVNDHTTDCFRHQELSHLGDPQK